MPCKFLSDWITGSVGLLPLWLAPNLVTLAGGLCILAAYVLNMWYSPTFTEEAPSWVYWLTALSVALYVNLDCMDGKQARRTKSSSPLGQLFDHGVDGLVLHMMLANIAASLGVGPGWKMAAGCLGIMVPWMLAQWEEYHTAVMMYGNAFYGVLEANYSICAVHIITAVGGLRFWRTPVTLPAWLMQHPSLQLARFTNAVGGAAGGGAGSPPGTQLTMSLAEIALILVGCAGVAQAFSNVARVFKAPPLSQKEVGHKQLGRMWALTHLAGLLLSMAVGAWALCVAADNTPSGNADQPWHVHLGRITYSLFGISYALTATQLIIAHMAKEPWSPCVVAVACPALHVLASYLGWPAQPELLVTLHALTLGYYATFVVGCCSQICDHLGIKCFTITQRAM